MKRAVTMGTVVALCAAAGAGLLAVAVLSANPFGRPVVSLAAAAEGGTTIYYQDPDGKPFYSREPKKTPDGRAWRAIPADADVSFDEPGEPSVSSKGAEAKSERKIKYYRNPMGLPDISPVPKKDSMGMDYIPVYEGDDSDDGAVKLSPGKIQRTGAKSEPVMRRAVKSIVRAPGVVLHRRLPRGVRDDPLLCGAV